jgi:hypothetical protein
MTSKLCAKELSFRNIGEPIANVGYTKFVGLMQRVAKADGAQINGRNLRRPQIVGMSPRHAGPFRSRRSGASMLIEAMFFPWAG